MNFLNKFKTDVKSVGAKVRANVISFTQYTPHLTKTALTAGFAVALMTNAAFADFSPGTAVNTMTGYITQIVSGVGTIYAFISVFNWLSAVKQEDPDRASKSIVNVFIAGALIAIGVISNAVVSALSGGSGGGTSSDVPE